MDAKYVKEYIYENNQIPRVLEELGMHHIQWHGNDYITCGMPDGDNTHSTTVYNDSFLGVIAYTRDIKDAYGVSDIISLVTFIKQCFFTQSINWLCDLFGLNYYSDITVIDDSLSFMQFSNSNAKATKASIVEELKPIPESKLDSYIKIGNKVFEDDNIDLDTQYEFELGLDIFDHRVSIPIRDEQGRLVGVKGRRIWDTVDDFHPKYIYMEKCAKSKILYGFYKTLPYIKQSNEVIVCEAEKGVMQLWSAGFKNAVAVGGHALSDWQVMLLVQSGAQKIIIAFDKDVKEEEIVKEGEKLSPFKRVEYIFDSKNILDEKQSPMDVPEKWKKLYNERKILL